MNEVAELSQNYLVGADSNAVPAGYKQTEVGMIPEDWDCLDFADMFTCRQGMQVPVEKQSLVESTHTVRFIRIIDLTDQQEPPRYISNPGDKYLVKKYDLFMVRYGVPGLIGFNYEGVIANNLFRIIPRMSCFTAFYAHYLSYRHKDILDSSGSSTMPAISFSTLARFKIIKPLSEKEQTAIANALSDVDALISELEKLIAKKQAIKTATMQQLLTGRTRLPQFALREDGTPKGTKPSELGEIPEDWEVVTLGTASSFINGRAYSLHEWENSGTPVIRLQNLTGRGDEYYYSNLQLPEKQYCKSGDLLFMWSATFGPVIWRGPKAIYHYHIWKIACEVGYGQSYLFYLLDDMTEKLKRSSSSGGTMLHVTKEKMESTKAAFPSYEEQTAIATILSDMDAEIQALEQRLGKTRQIKQGMMQELLTGKTRLVQPSLTGVCHAD
ncbi:hypothetical protein BOO30_11695 [Vibrio navarrensis]|jgi:type I restriction enzyme S subunit|uniref:restriction endonuclease subunit S n=1 Tax=Vibrio navarrensis TaxID=29495 RepID=UPI00186A6E1B|nr:restriction endonuclease subunit S [Vibrio navarrensis]MBE4578392.1 hypothetical protein [Vibrio navarrensis]MBE4597060.1 hypothetical protein [Vibrio navarrensis]